MFDIFAHLTTLNRKISLIDIADFLYSIFVFVPNLKTIQNSSWKKNSIYTMNKNWNSIIDNLFFGCVQHNLDRQLDSISNEWRKRISN